MIYLAITPGLAFSVLASYFVLLIFISYFTSRNSNNVTFFTANKQSPWFVVAFGMIGASLSGVTFISVPGAVGGQGWMYFQMVLGYLLGYLVIGKVLLPLYYRLELISIYTYLEQRFGTGAYKIGAAFFLISRAIGAAFRLFLVAMVLQMALFDAWGLPFWLAVLISIGLIFLYTFQGGIKTIVWTDTFQTLFMLLAAGMSIYFIYQELGLDATKLMQMAQDHELTNIFVWDVNHPQNFFKNFFAGSLIAVVMTGLDQDMMQKNLTCRNIQDAQKNMFWFSICLVFANLLFLVLGAMLFIYAFENQIPIPDRADALFPTIALAHFDVVAGVCFLLGITAAAYSSADSALTSMTTSFCIDILGNKAISKQRRIGVHIGISLILFGIILVFHYYTEQSVINALFTAAGYTYGPLLGMFTFGLLTNWKPVEYISIPFSTQQIKLPLIPLICIVSPILAYFINEFTTTQIGFKFGFLILAVNGLICFIGLAIASLKNRFN